MTSPNAFRFDDHPEGQKFAPVVETEIAALEKRRGFVFCDDYRAFLRRLNGYNFDSLTSAPAWAKDYFIVDYVRYLYGVGTGWRYNDLDEALDCCALDLAYLGFVYPIGAGPGGNPLVQVHQGALRNRVMLVDNDAIMSADAFESAFGRRLGSYSADQILPWLRDEQGSFLPVADSFEDFIQRLVIGREDNGNINVTWTDGTQ
jgi:hypothetical protein